MPVSFLPEPHQPHTGPFSGWQLAAVKSALGSLESLCQPAAAAKAAAPPPSNTWPQYAKALQRLVTGEVPDTWQAATTAAAIELLTGKPQAGSAAGVLSADAAAHTRDAAWARAVAAAGATPADAHGDEDAAARHVVLGQLRLQLLLVEEQLVAATGEAPYLAADAEAFGEDENDEHEGEGVEESSEGEAGHPAAAAADGDRDGMEVDGEEEKESPAGGKGAAAKRGRPRQGVKRAASSNSLQAGSEEGDAPHEDEPASKRRKGAAAAAAGKDAAAAAAGGSGGGRKAAAAAAAGLPPRPVSRNKGRVSRAGQADASRAPSRQNSLAPAHSGALPAAAAAAAGGGRGQKRGRTASLEVRCNLYSCVLLLI